ncbi:MAG TPA: hypothetical protein DDX98_15370 [Bacteroidales bacterium]|jgi:hypothetical protein|nr:hypothetical protein [Bacteroidales bacterium]
MNKYLIILCSLVLLFSCEKQDNSVDRTANLLADLAGYYCGYKNYNQESDLYYFEIKSTHVPDSFVFIDHDNLFWISELNMLLQGDTILFEEDYSTLKDIHMESGFHCDVILKTSGKGFYYENNKELVTRFINVDYCINSAPHIVTEYTYVLKNANDYPFEGIYGDKNMDTLLIVKSDTGNEYNIKVINSAQMPYKGLAFNAVKEKCCFTINRSNTDFVKVLCGYIDFQVYKILDSRDSISNKFDMRLQYEITSEEVTKTMYYSAEFIKI